MIIGHKIRELRELSGMFQRELAAKLEIGEGFLSKVEHNQKLIKRVDLKKISLIFSYPLKELETLWLASKVYVLVKNEENNIDVLRVAEEHVRYFNKGK
jgi:transcriptional regulator with XRE-family HTH domain